MRLGHCLHCYPLIVTHVCDVFSNDEIICSVHKVKGRCVNYVFFLERCIHNTLNNLWTLDKYLANYYPEYLSICYLIYHNKLTDISPITKMVHLHDLW